MTDLALIYTWIDLIGAAVFAISGTLMASRKYMDGFGVVVLASITAIGGGTVRDVILDAPVFWVIDDTVFLAIFVGASLTVVWLRFFSKIPYVTLLIADAIGLAFFAMIGVQKALDYGTTGMVAVMMGTITGVFGGLMRDVICREIPLVLKSELYATTAIAGGIVCVQLMALDLDRHVCLLLGMLTTLLLRFAAIRWGWSIPVFQDHSHANDKSSDT